MPLEPYYIDATGKILGRVASEAALVLRGKHDPAFAPYRTPRQKVVINNAAHIRISGNKENAKVYTRYSGYPSGLKRIPYARVLAENPERIMRHAIAGMLPKNKLRRIMLNNLTIHDRNE